MMPAPSITSGTSAVHALGVGMIFHGQFLLVDIKHVISHVFGVHDDWGTVGLGKEFSAQVKPLLCKHGT